MKMTIKMMVEFNQHIGISVQTNAGLAALGRS